MRFTRRFANRPAMWLFPYVSWKDETSYPAMQLVSSCQDMGYVSLVCRGTGVYSHLIFPMDPITVIQGSNPVTWGAMSDQHGTCHGEHGHPTHRHHGVYCQRGRRMHRQPRVHGGLCYEAHLHRKNAHPRKYDFLLEFFLAVLKV